MNRATSDPVNAPGPFGRTPSSVLHDFDCSTVQNAYMCIGAWYTISTYDQVVQNTMQKKAVELMHGKKNPTDYPPSMITSTGKW